MNEKPLILFHGGCTDGLTAAWVAARALGDVEAIPVFYGQPLPDVSNRRVIILDFSYKRPVMEQVANDAATLLILDHHKTAEADLAGFQEWAGLAAINMPLVSNFRSPNSPQSSERKSLSNFNEEDHHGEC